MGPVLAAFAALAAVNETRIRCALDFVVGMRVAAQLVAQLPRGDLAPCTS
jgi:hypothetical protein